ncbi:MAG: DUF4159 domain-containing protein [Thermoguttaceae bacterium]|jgi:hypothetical protein
MNLNRFFLLLTALLLTAIFVSAETVFAAEGEGYLTPEEVQRAIDGGIAFLEKKQYPDGSWEEDAYRQYAPGTTALCLLALLSSGRTVDDAAVAKGLRYLERYTPEMQGNQTYPIALQTMVFCLADPERLRGRIEENVAAILRGRFRTENPFSGGWSYSDLGQRLTYGIADNSNTQFAVLALYEAEKAGVEIPESVWSEIEDYWVRLQNKDGSWGYRAEFDRASGKLAVNNPSGSGSGSMTCAGIVSLWIADAHRVSGASVSGEQIGCCADDLSESHRERIEKGFEWLATHFSVKSNPGSGTYFYYYLYGLERTGRLTARRFFGSSDWYREGAEYLLERTSSGISAFWKAGSSGETLDTVATSFALLFLSKGRWPVLVSKLQYGAAGASEDSPAEWNRHPDDLDHLTRHMERRWAQNLTWQVIDAAKAEPEDYAQTPVLSISGRVSPLPENAEARRELVGNLREYLEEGGFILAEALDGDESFESGFRELMKLILPDEENGGLDLLPEDHPIWRMEARVDPNFLRPLYGADLGCRTSVVFVPAVGDDEGTVSLSCLWELADDMRRGPAYAESVEKRIRAALDIGQNILAYATGRDEPDWSLKNKDEAATQSADGTGKGDRDFYAAILTLGKGSPCAPRAIPNLMKKIRRDLEVPVQTSVRRVRPEPEELGTAPLLFFHGRRAFTLTESQTGALRDYFAWGGFLFANAICGSRPFSDSFAVEMKKVFPDASFEPIPPDDPLFTSLYGGTDIKTVEIRRRAPSGGGAGEGERSRWQTVAEPPRFYGIRQEGRWVVIFSPHDVACALEGGASGTYSGYTADSAYKIGVNVVFYALEHL